METHYADNLQYGDSLRRQSPRCRNLWRRKESGVVEAWRAHKFQLIGGNIYQGYKNCVFHFDERYEKQRGNVHMCIGAWLERGYSGFEGGWVQSPVVTSRCRGWEQFCSRNQKINLFHLRFLFLLYLLSLPLSWLHLVALSYIGSDGTIGPCSPDSVSVHIKKIPPKKSRQKKNMANSTSQYHLHHKTLIEIWLNA